MYSSEYVDVKILISMFVSNCRLLALFLSIHTSKYDVVGVAYHFIRINMMHSDTIQTGLSIQGNSRNA